MAWRSGTAYYMPPEQWQGDEVDARADVYSLGIMLYEMLAGALPFEADNPNALMWKHCHEPPRLCHKHYVSLLRLKLL